MATTPPIELVDVKAFLNIPTSDTTKDVEVWAMAVAATEAVEARVGLLTVATVTETVRATGYAFLELSKGPVVAVSAISKDGVSVDLTNVDCDPDTGFVTGLGQCLLGRYDVSYTSGRTEVPEALKQVVLLLTEQLFQSQRGPSTTAKFSSNAGAAIDNSTWRYKGFLWPRRAQELAEPYADMGNA